MSRSLERVAVELQETATALLREVQSKRWSVAQPYARGCARAAGQLLQRLTVMMEILEDDGGNA